MLQEMVERERETPTPVELIQTFYASRTCATDLCNDIYPLGNASMDQPRRRGRRNFI